MCCPFAYVITASFLRILQLHPSQPRSTQLFHKDDSHNRNDYDNRCYNKDFQHFLTSPFCSLHFPNFKTKYRGKIFEKIR